MAIRRAHFRADNLRHPHAGALRHLVHDPRFWAVLAIVVLAVIMILSFTLARPDLGRPAPNWPLYPNYGPFMP